MKNIAFCALLILAMGFSSCIFQHNRQNRSESINPDPAHNSMISLDWSGTYRRIDSIGDNGGIKTEVRLNSDLTFQFATRKPIKNGSIKRLEGTFVWDETGGIITMNFSDPTIVPLRYRVGENILFKLDSDGKRIEAPEGDRYNLTKSGVFEIYDNFWRLTELFEKPVSTAPDQFREPHLIVRSIDNRINGNGGCNNFFGSYEILEPNQIRFLQIGSTKMACPDMQPEYQFLRALDLASSYTLRGDTLVLHDSSTTEIARFEYVFLNPIE